MSFYQAAAFARISGHESFPFRHGWLPKAAQLIAAQPDRWADPSEAMVALGLGKNMVVALRFWADATGLTTPTPDGVRLTAFGRSVFGRRGFDPYLEQPTTLWLLHWHLVHATPPLLAWQSVFVGGRGREFTRAEMLTAWQAALAVSGRTASTVTLQQHFDMLIHSYVSPTDTADRDRVEDGVECPLRELRLLEFIGIRRGPGGKSESVYGFRRGVKLPFSTGTLAYAIADYWRRERSDETTLALHDLTGAAGLASTFAISENDVLDRLEELEVLTHGALVFHASRGVPRLLRADDAWTRDWLTMAYEQRFSAETLGGVYAAAKRSSQARRRGASTPREPLPPASRSRRIR